MLGALVGDIVGSIYEFKNHRSKVFALFGPRCTFTDDSVLTVALAETILKNGDFATAMRRFGRLYPTRAGDGSGWSADPSMGPGLGNGGDAHQPGRLGVFHARNPDARGSSPR
jgi:hypothetical protein